MRIGRKVANGREKMWVGGDWVGGDLCSALSGCVSSSVVLQLLQVGGVQTLALSAGTGHLSFSHFSAGVQTLGRRLPDFSASSAADSQGMFVLLIKGQDTEEQLEKWLPMAYKMQIIGCYVQTELGHDSNVQGLETTATFDPKTDDFVIHSPTWTSSKIWTDPESLTPN